MKRLILVLVFLPACFASFSLAPLPSGEFLVERISDLEQPGKSLVVSSALVLDAPLKNVWTVPSDSTIRFVVPGSVEIPDGKTLKIEGSMMAGATHVFSCAGSGRVLFGPGAATELVPQWWYDGDWAAALFACLSAAAQSGIPTLIPAGTYPLSRLIPNISIAGSTLTIRGAGNAVLQSSVVDPPTEDALLHIKTDADSTVDIEDLTILHSTKSALVGTLNCITVDPLGSASARSVIARNVTLRGATMTSFGVRGAVRVLVENCDMSEARYAGLDARGTFVTVRGGRYSSNTNDEPGTGGEGVIVGGDVSIVEDVYADGNSRYGIDARHASMATIGNCRVSRNGLGGIYAVDDGGDKRINQLKIVGNYIEGTGVGANFGMWVGNYKAPSEAFRNILITGNTISRCTTVGINVTGPQAGYQGYGPRSIVISDNQITFSAGTKAFNDTAGAIWVAPYGGASQFEQVVIRSNTVESYMPQLPYGIRVTGANHATVVENMITSHDSTIGVGISCFVSATYNVSNNQLLASFTRAPFELGPAAAPPNRLQQNNIRYP